jgi:hypothetical protein
MSETITDDTMAAFQRQLSQLGQEQKNTPAVPSFLKMMQSLGKYLGSKKNKAHADSIPVLTSMANQLDKIITQPDLKNDETSQILYGELQKYKSLKHKITSRPAITDTDLNDLKAVILAIDWEISDTTLKNFETIVTNLLSKLKGNNLQHTFLKIIHTTGRYIGIQKANAPGDSISFLRSVFDNFEQIVHTPDMALKDKKKILEKDIQRFHDFKHTISRKKNRVDLTSDTAEEDVIQPALSHITQTGISSKNDRPPLTPLPEPEALLETGNEPDPDTLVPALTDKRLSPPGPRDVMDDLFSLKESPADELLDAIHLLDVQGQTPYQDNNRPDQTRTPQSDGITDFTPQRRDNDPIPEIGSRLDEFFSLDDSETNGGERDDQKEPPVEISAGEADDTAEGIVPFQYEDEDFEAPPQPSDGYKSESLNPDSDILNRLKSTIEESEWLQYEASMLSVTEDMAYLETRWQTDPDKTCLLEIIASNIHLLKTQSETIQQINADMAAMESDTAATDTARGTPPGLWGRIKKIFTA